LWRRRVPRAGGGPVGWGPAVGRVGAAQAGRGGGVAGLALGAELGAAHARRDVGRLAAR